MTSFTRFDSGSRGNNCFFQLRSDYKAPSDTDSLNEVSPSYPFSTPDRRFHARKKIALGSIMTLTKNINHRGTLNRKNHHYPLLLSTLSRKLFSVCKTTLSRNSCIFNKSLFLFFISDSLPSFFVSPCHFFVRLYN